MEEVLRSLGGLILKAIPTLLLVILLHFYLKRMFFGPMARVLSERYKATEGARKLADDSLARASQKAAEYESAIRAARADIYREQEQFRQAVRQDQAGAIAEARQRAGANVREASRQLAGELDQAKLTLALQTESLADQIAKTVLERRPA